MQDEKEDLINEIELAYIKFAGFLVEYAISKSEEIVNVLEIFLVDYIRPSIDKFKKDLSFQYHSHEVLETYEEIKKEIEDEN